jgi:hypothetical protein
VVVPMVEKEEEEAVAGRGWVGDEDEEVVLCAC